MPIQQLSNYRRGGSVLEKNEQLMVTDIANIIAAVNEGGTGEVVGTSIWANGFRVVGCIAENILLPENANLEYTGPLSICVGASITVPVGTTLTIV
jgi:NADPH:quinone reductase-like Zn-dependent oxidoreductase